MYELQSNCKFCNKKLIDITSYHDIVQKCYQCCDTDTNVSYEFHPKNKQLHTIQFGFNIKYTYFIVSLNLLLSNTTFYSFYVDGLEKLATINSVIPFTPQNISQKIKTYIHYL